ncbi:MAG: hypothetical protein ACRETO_04250 [Gammaproteobacteria bacterium]
MGIDRGEIDRRLRYVGFGPDDATKITSLMGLVCESTEVLASAFSTIWRRWTEPKA